jgi:hypothetical protein
MSVTLNLVYRCVKLSIEVMSLTKSVSQERKGPWLDAPYAKEEFFLPAAMLLRPLVKEL